MSAIQSGKRPMRCRKMTDKGDLQVLPAPVADQLDAKEDGSACVHIMVPGTLKEATTQEALQRGQVKLLMVQDEPVNGGDLVDVIKHYKEVSQLRSVYLRNCYLGVCGGKQMARSLGDLSVLYLHGNGIKDAGIKTIAAALAGNTNLTVLGLCEEEFGAFGAQMLAAALQANTYLTLLDIRGNKITQDGCREIAYALLRNPGSRVQHLLMDTEYGGIVKGEYQGLLRAFKMQFKLQMSG